MKLVSSSPKTKHTHRVRSSRSGFWRQVRSQLLNPRFLRILALLLVVVVAVSAFRWIYQMVSALAGSQ